MTSRGAETLSLIRRAHALFTAGDFSEIRELVTEDVEWGTTGRFPGIDHVYRGPEGMAKWAADLRGPMKSFEVRLGDVLVARDDRILIEERLRARGSESGIEATMVLYSAYLIREGKLAKRVCYVDRDEALAAIDRL